MSLTWDVIESDCIQHMKTLETSSVDAVVTDPPYDLTAGKKGGSGPASVNLDSPYGRSRITTGNGGGFMGKPWDATGIAFRAETWAEALRVLKPGGHLLAFGGTRTYHRMVCAIEDAGFEIRDSIHWMYGSGFPKSLDVSKALDKAAGAEREVIGIKPSGPLGGKRDGSATGVGTFRDDAWVSAPVNYETAPATNLAKQWEGWGTALKPAHEPVVMARKPLTGTVAANVTTWGVGAINVDGCRVPFQGEADRAQSETKNQHTRYANPNSNRDSYSGNFPSRTDYDGSLGRWPANVILSCQCEGDSHEPGCPVALLDAQSGGASRFYYVAKASRRERSCDGIVECSHPTVKPIALMRYLCRLVTPPGGLVLDPFCGSGTTGIACVQEGFNFLGIERDASYCETARQRISHWGSS